MNKAVIYISGTTDETVNNMIVDVLERYCEKHEYEIVALLGENSQAGMSMPMKYSFIGMSEVEDIDAVVTLSGAMVGRTDKEIMETIELLAYFGITVETAKEDMDEYQEIELITKIQLENIFVRVQELYQVVLQFILKK
ncbi:MAG: hypothetical protein EGR71_04810 [Clostridiales bacterium]|jgi:hypothetical protein|nr:hypothetical protein [Clostridiales bacterium]